jgi:ribonucleoside-diphosphate reductase alpha chain
MLTTIIKRSGKTEPYTPTKINNWGEWAAKKLGDRVDWGSVVMDTVKQFSGSVQSQVLQKELINQCLYRKDWPHNLMAGRLLAATLRKELYDELIPSVKSLVKKLEKLGLMKHLDYSDDDFAIAEKIIDHDRDFDMSHMQISQIRKKYSIQNRTTKEEYETPQFVYMRMALHLAEDEPKDVRMEHVKNFYNHFSFNRINAPSPNYINLGTNHKGYASCCLYTVGDTADSLAIGDHIAYKMTVMSAGIGGYIGTRSIGDPIRGGAIVHQGKMPYFKAVAGAVTANIQAGRGGACTQYYTVFDPEAKDFALAQNPRTPTGKQNRDIHFAAMLNRLVIKKLNNKGKIFAFTTYSAPDLMKALFSGDQDKFEEIYNKYENDDSFEKTYVDAEDICQVIVQQGFEVATHYLAFIDEINRHTPFNEPIHSSNLCLEITQPTSPYYRMTDLYSEEDHGNGEVSLCSLGGIVEPNIRNDQEYESAAYYALKMIDKCIHISDYPLPHVGFTAKRRLNAGVGLLGVAYSLARKGIRYSSDEGLAEHHKISERHSYWVIRASLRLGKELGNAPWINKTKWPQGWLPIDTYKKSIDKLIGFDIALNYDWEQLRAEIIQNKGIRNSSLIAHMPTESSSKASGIPNSIYPVRELSMKKSDVSNILDWVAPDSDIYGENYELAWNIPSKRMIPIYGIYQKFTDQAISADLWKDRSINPTISKKEILEELILMFMAGMKTRYYQNSKTSKQSNKIEESEKSTQNPIEAFIDEDSRGCAGGSCTL